MKLTKGKTNYFDMKPKDKKKLINKAMEMAVKEQQKTMNKHTHFVSSNKEDTYKHSKERVVSSGNPPTGTYFPKTTIEDRFEKDNCQDWELILLETLRKLWKNEITLNWAQIKVREIIIQAERNRWIEKIEGMRRKEDLFGKDSRKRTYSIAWNDALSDLLTTK